MKISTTFFSYSYIMHTNKKTTLIIITNKFIVHILSLNILYTRKAYA